jgi:hypothetical protein
MAAFVKEADMLASPPPETAGAAAPGFFGAEGALISARFAGARSRGLFRGRRIDAS